MALIECSGAISVQSSVLGLATMSGYIWCTREKIIQYLDRESVIRVGGFGAIDFNYSEVDAKGMENGQVYEVLNYLSAVYTITESDSESILVEVVAKLTAAQIGLARMGSSMGNELTPWTERLKNEAWSTLQRIFINQTLAQATPKSIPLWLRLIMAKTRERAVVANV